MKIEFLGSGGAITIPRPGCRCRICQEARKLGVPFSRSGPSVFVHGPDVLFDTPEENKDQLNRSTVERIEACFYSHWHPDHVMGRRVWETRNADFRHFPPRNRTTDIYLPEQVAEDFQTWLGLAEHFSFMEEKGWVNVIKLSDGNSVEMNGIEIQPFRLAEDYVYAFLLEGENQRVLIAPDELNGWEPPEEVKGLDLAVLPMGICEVDPLTGERRMPEDHPVLDEEATFRETLDIVKQLNAKRIIMTHIEEPAGLSYSDLLKLQERLQQDGWPITFAYDTMTAEI
ncbi:MAG TPA: MBL fold metallo-hydrolase [Bacillales bacterium]|nr:MBL fold metallo-hydrolase [Bacillales bacterium]